MSAARQDRVLQALLVWTTLVTGVLFWLPFVRSIGEGDDYRWALSSRLGGRGLHGDFWFVVLGVAFALIMLYLGRRGAVRPFHMLLLSFHALLATLVIAAAIAHPEQLRFEGATFGIDVSLAVVGPLLFVAVALLALYWVLNDVRVAPRRFTAVPGWSRASKVRLALALALFPLEVVLLRAPLASRPEMLGIALLFWQWILLNRAMNPARS